MVGSISKNWTKWETYQNVPTQSSIAGIAGRDHEKKKEKRRETKREWRMVVHRTHRKPSQSKASRTINIINIRF